MTFSPRIFHPSDLENMRPLTPAQKARMDADDCLNQTDEDREWSAQTAEAFRADWAREEAERPNRQAQRALGYARNLLQLDPASIADAIRCMIAYREPCGCTLSGAQIATILARAEGEVRHAPKR